MICTYTLWILVMETQFECFPHFYVVLPFFNPTKFCSTSYLLLFNTQNPGLNQFMTTSHSLSSHAFGWVVLAWGLLGSCVQTKAGAGVIWRLNWPGQMIVAAGWELSCDCQQEHVPVSTLHAFSFSQGFCEVTLSGGASSEQTLLRDSGEGS